MRVRPFGLSLAAFVALNAAQTTADTIPPSLHLARVSGVTLVVNPIGTKPCDFNLGRLTTDIEFVLNSGMINFDSSETAGENGWPRLVVSTVSSETASGCIWTMEAGLYVRPDSAVALGLPYSGSINLWNAKTFGMAPGNGLTATVSDQAQTAVKILINSIRDSQRVYPQ
jgi:hypothetical protein